MLRIVAEFPSDTYYWASEDLDYGDQFYEGRIINGFEIVRFMAMAEKTGNRLRTMTVRIDNRDLGLNQAQTDDGFLNQKYTLYFDDGANSTKKMVGRCKRVNSFGLEIDLTVNEIGYEWLEEPFPDAQIAYDYYSDQGINDSWNAIPICFGYVKRLPVMWVDKVNSRFIVCSGPIEKISKVYFDKVVMYDSSTGQNGYQYDPKKPQIKVRVFAGSGALGYPEIVGGEESQYPGFAYIEFYDADTGTALEPILSDGNVPRIFVDLEGIKELTIDSLSATTGAVGETITIDGGSYTEVVSVTFEGA